MGFLFLGTVLLNVYAALLVLFRAVSFKTKIYRPMLWNIFLSILPAIVLATAFLIFSIVTISFGLLTGFIVLAIFGIIWILILPNSSYLITELNQSHRTKDDKVPLWYDIILVISLAMSGVANTIVNVFLAHLIFSVVFGEDSSASIIKPGVLAGVAIILILISFGMYLGRYLRLNSWDIKNPARLIKKIITHFREPQNLKYAFGFTFTYAIFLAIMYVLIVGPIISEIFRIEALRDL